MVVKAGLGEEISPFSKHSAMAAGRYGKRRPEGRLLRIPTGRAGQGPEARQNVVLIDTPESVSPA